MPKIYLDAGSITSLATLTTGGVVLTNLSPTPLNIIESATTPGAYEAGVVVSSLPVVLNSTTNQWVRVQQDTIILLEPIHSSAAPYSVSSPPKDLLDGTLHNHFRIKTQHDRAAFYEGREARTQYEISIAPQATLYILVENYTDVIVHELTFTIDTGGVRFTTIRSPVLSGTWGTILPVTPKNLMASRPQPYYVPQSTFKVGGTATGTEHDVKRIVASTQPNKQGSVGMTPDDMRGVPTGSKFVLKLESLVNNLTTTGTFNCWWEEVV